MNLAAGTVLSANVRDQFGTLLFAAGSIVTAPVTLPAGTQFDAGMKLPGSASLGGDDLAEGCRAARSGHAEQRSRAAAWRGAALGHQCTCCPSGLTSVDLRPGAAGKLYAVAAMLPEGSQSWSVRLVAGADTGAADSRLINPSAKHGDLVLADNHYGLYGKPTPESILLTYYGSGELHRRR